MSLCGAQRDDRPFTESFVRLVASSSAPGLLGSPLAGPAGCVFYPLLRLVLLVGIRHLFSQMRLETVK